MIEELERILREKEKDSPTALERLTRYWSLATEIEPNVRIKVCRDPTDDFILECAIAAKADIVASDPDLQVLHREKVAGRTLRVYNVSDAYSNFVALSAIDISTVEFKKTRDCS